MKSVYYPATSRGFARHGWLTTHHSFSFASYYDPERMGFGALRVLNDDIIAPGTGFGKHPHDNMEIITIPLSGTLRHEDTMGNSATIVAGEVQVMSAGGGVEHAEYNASETESLSLLQIWIETARRDVTPRYDQRRFDPSEWTGKFAEVVGPMGGDTLGIYQDASLSLGRFVAGQDGEYILKKSHRGVFVFIIEGSGAVAGRQMVQRDTLEITETERFSVRAEKDFFVLLIEVLVRG